MIANVSIFPIGKGSSLSRHVAEAVLEAEKSGLDYRLTSMGTILEGDWDEVLAVVKKMRNRLAKHSDRLYLTISIDDRKGAKKRLDGKVKSVEKILGKKPAR